jgi:1-acyl-sn-glycerol-3-phosphate acyltransferase
MLGRLSMRLSGWTFTGPLPEVSKFVIIVAPHTSNWDFPAGLQAKWALELDANWFGKASLFRGPLGFVMRRFGGRPVNRDSAEGVVREVAAMFSASSQFVLALAPEGTRKQVTNWRTGFYHIAVAAGVPIVPVALDWSRRQVVINPPFLSTGMIEKDLHYLRSLYRVEMCRNPRGFWTEPE